MVSTAVGLDRGLSPAKDARARSKREKATCSSGEALSAQRRPLQHLRAQQHATPPRRTQSVAVDGPATSNVVRALSAQLAALKKQHHDEITALNAALAAAHGELLQLRRELAAAAPRASRSRG
jgi:hypothetical protein